MRFKKKKMLEAMQFGHEEIQKTLPGSDRVDQIVGKGN